MFYRTKLRKKNKLLVISAYFLVQSPLQVKSKQNSCHQSTINKKQMFVNNFDNLCTFCDEAETGFLSTRMTLCNSSFDTVPSAAAVTVMLRKLIS